MPNRGRPLTRGNGDQDSDLDVAAILARTEHFIRGGEYGAADTAQGGATDGATLQDATKDYNESADFGAPAAPAPGASAEAAGGNEGGLQNATNLAQSPPRGANEPNAEGNEPNSRGLPARAPRAVPGAVPATVPAALDPRQRDAIELILLGRSDRAVAAAVKVHRVTVTKWRLYDPAFQAALNRRRQERWDNSEERVRSLLRRAVKVFERQLRSDDPDVCYRAAKALVQMAGAGRFAPPPLPADPAAALDLFAREKHVERASDDPRTEPLNDRDRWL